MTEKQLKCLCHRPARDHPSVFSGQKRPAPRTALAHRRARLGPHCAPQWWPLHRRSSHWRGRRACLSPGAWHARGPADHDADPRFGSPPSRSRSRRQPYLLSSRIASSTSMLPLVVTFRTGPTPRSRRATCSTRRVVSTSSPPSTRTPTRPSPSRTPTCSPSSPSTGRCFESGTAFRYDNANYVALASAKTGLWRETDSGTIYVILMPGRDPHART